MSSAVTGGLADPAGNIIFVTGAARSGTTLMCRILGNHSTILGLNELHFFGALVELEAVARPHGAERLENMAAMMFARQARDVWASGPTAEERELARQLVQALPPERRTPANVYAESVALLASGSGKRVGCEQTPRNIFYASALLELYPDARVIHMVRDPRAVLASQKNRWKVRRLGGKNVPWSEILRLWCNYHPVTMSRLWRQATRVALQLEDHPRCRLVRFEDLVAEPEATVQSVCDWLGVDFAPAMLEVPQWGSSNIRHGQKQGVSADMAGKWRSVLSEAEVQINERMTRTELARFGYTAVTERDQLSPGIFAWMLLRYPVHIVGAVVTNPRRVWIQLRALLRA